MKTVLALLFLTPLIVLANGGGYITGVKSTGAFQPIGIDQVEMLSERLEIDLHIEYADIRIEYVLHNPGKKVKVEAGFPVADWSQPALRYGLGKKELGKEEMRTELEKTVAVKLENFSASLDGESQAFQVSNEKLKLVDVRMGGYGREVTGWYKVKFSFGEGQARKLKIHYRQTYGMKHETVSDESSSSAAALEYLFSAAGLWAGSIRDGVVKVRPISIDASKVRLSHPKSFTRTKEGWEWVFRDFEPTLEDDLTIFVRPAVNRYPVYENGPSEGAPWIGDYVAEGLQWKKGEPYGGTWSMHRRDFEANASSTLPPEAGKTYSAEHVVLGRGAWVEGVSGQGIGESLTLKLKQPVPVKKLGIRTGYTESEELYLANSRPAALDVTVNGGKPRNVRIPDECLTREFFFFDLPPTEGPVKTIQLKITEVYPGTQFEDTAISQLILVQPLSKAPKFQPAR